MGIYELKELRIAQYYFETTQKNLLRVEGDRV